MLTLPPIAVSYNERSFQWSLPCPAVELIRLVTIASDQADEMNKLLRDNPALLLYCAAIFRQETGLAVDTFSTLQRWCLTHLLDRLYSSSHDWSTIGRPVSVTTIKEYARVRTFEDLVVSLVSLLTETVECRRKIAKHFLRQIFGDQFTIDGSNPLSRRQRKRRRRTMVRSWQQPMARSVDITTLLRFRNQLKHDRSEFDDRLLRQKMDAMKQLAYGASHEINNPLANIATRAQTLLSGEENDERRHKLSVIYEQAMRAHEMISDLMLFANPPTLDCVSTDLRVWTASIINEIEPALGQSQACGLRNEAAKRATKIELEVRFGPGVRDLTMDATHLSVAVKSLLKNSIESIRASQGAGRIELRVYVENDAVSISVTDNGGGVSEAARGHLFDPFYSGREAGRGLGFGLSKAWRIAELHGGQLRYDDQHSPGARFVIRIPRTATKLTHISQSLAFVLPTARGPERNGAMDLSVNLKMDNRQADR